jgi:hypothetical protein
MENLLLNVYSLINNILSILLAVISIIVTISIAFIVLYYDSRRHKESQTLQRDLNKPIITFKISFIKIKNEEKAFYKITNSGKGVALNIYAAVYSKREDNEWEEIVKCYSLGERDELILCWKSGGDQWIIRYEDIFKNKYCSICIDDSVEFYDFIDEKSKIDKKTIDKCKKLNDYIEDYAIDLEKIKRLWALSEEGSCSEILKNES